MAIRIIDAKLTPQQTTVGQPVIVEIKVSDNSWDIIKNEFIDWQAVKDGLSSWQDIYNI